MPKYDFDIIVIGGGIAGFAAAGMAAGVGKRVLLIEKDRLGGNCTLRTCMPTKSLIRSGIVRDILLCANKYGLRYSFGDINTDNVMPYIRTVIDDVAGIDTVDSLNKMGIEVVFGSPKFINNHTIKLGENAISGDKFIIATGSRPATLQIDGYADAAYYNNETIFELEKLPSSVIVVGGGPAGIEFAIALRLLGLDDCCQTS